MTFADVLQRKRDDVFLHRGDVVEVKENPDWMKRYVPGKGGVGFDFICKCCGEIMVRDRTNPDLDDSVWEHHLMPHLKSHLS